MDEREKMADAMHKHTLLRRDWMFQCADALIAAGFGDKATVRREALEEACVAILNIRTAGVAEYRMAEKCLEAIRALGKEPTDG